MLSQHCAIAVAAYTRTPGRPRTPFAGTHVARTWTAALRPCAGARRSTWTAPSLTTPTSPSRSSRTTRTSTRGFRRCRRHPSARSSRKNRPPSASRSRNTRGGPSRHAPPNGPSSRADTAGRRHISAAGTMSMKMKVATSKAPSGACSRATSASAPYATQHPSSAASFGTLSSCST